MLRRLILSVLFVLVGAAVVQALPELARYLKMREM